MKVYFTASLFQAEKYGKYYRRIVEYLEKNGCNVQSDHVLGRHFTEVFDDTDDEKVKYYSKFLKWINTCDVVIAEASFPSTVNLGHEISVAIEKGKPVIVLFEENKSPIFLEGITAGKVLVQEYNDSNLEKVLEEALEYASSQQDTRFNFFVSPRIASYLDWISKIKKVPRAVYLRGLIKDAINNDMLFRGEEK